MLAPLSIFKTHALFSYIFKGRPRPSSRKRAAGQGCKEMPPYSPVMGENGGKAHGYALTSTSNQSLKQRYSCGIICLGVGFVCEIVSFHRFKRRRCRCPHTCSGFFVPHGFLLSVVRPCRAALFISHKVHPSGENARGFHGQETSIFHLNRREFLPFPAVLSLHPASSLPSCRAPRTAARRRARLSRSSSYLTHYFLSAAGYYSAVVVLVASAAVVAAIGSASSASTS